MARCRCSSRPAPNPACLRRSARRETNDRRHSQRRSQEGVQEVHAVIVEDSSRLESRSDRSLDVYVSRLRAKLEQAMPELVLIHTHFGIGYRFSAETA